MHIYSWKGLHTSLWLSTTDTNTRLLFIKKNILSVYYCQYCNAGNVKHIIMAVFNMWNTKIACQGLNLKQQFFAEGGSTKKFQFWSLQHGWGWRPCACPFPVLPRFGFWMRNLIFFASSSTLWLSMSGKSSFILQLKKSTAAAEVSKARWEIETRGNITRLTISWQWLWPYSFVAVH